MWTTANNKQNIEYFLLFCHVHVWKSFRIICHFIDRGIMDFNFGLKTYESTRWRKKVTNIEVTRISTKRWPVAYESWSCNNKWHKEFEIGCAKRRCKVTERRSVWMSGHYYLSILENQLVFWRTCSPICSENFLRHHKSYMRSRWPWCRVLSSL